MGLDAQIHWRSPKVKYVKDYGVTRSSSGGIDKRGGQRLGGVG